MPTFPLSGRSVLMVNYDGVLICGRNDRDLAASGDRPRWPTNKLTWAFTGPLLTGFSDLDLKGCFVEAFARWSRAANISGEYTGNAATANILIGFGQIDGPQKVLAYSELADGTMRQKRQTYDNGERFVIADNPPADRIDLIRVACHELGHVLGIPHIGPGNLMAPTYSTLVRGPQTGDVAEIMSRYGAVVPDGPPQTPGPGIVKNLFQLQHRESGLWIVTPDAEWKIG